jgi:hypothetical protein
MKSPWFRLTDGRANDADPDLNRNAEINLRTGAGAAPRSWQPAPVRLGVTGE